MPISLRQTLTKTVKSMCFRGCVRGGGGDRPVYSAPMFYVPEILYLHNMAQSECVAMAHAKLYSTGRLFLYNADENKKKSIWLLKICTIAYVAYEDNAYVCLLRFGLPINRKENIVRKKLLVKKWLRPVRVTPNRTRIIAVPTA